MNSTPLLNRSAVRKFLLETGRELRAHKWTRVSDQTLLEANEAVRQWLVARVKASPSKGKTL